MSKNVLVLFSELSDWEKREKTPEKSPVWDAHNWRDKEVVRMIGMNKGVIFDFILFCLNFLFRRDCGVAKNMQKKGGKRFLYFCSSRLTRMASDIRKSALCFLLLMSRNIPLTAGVDDLQQLLRKENFLIGIVIKLKKMG